MKRIVMIGLAAALVSTAIGGCPSPQQPDPQPGVISVLVAGSYTGSVVCVLDDQTQGRDSTYDLLVTDEGGLRINGDNIATGVTLSLTQFGITVAETIDQITETADTVTMKTTGSISSDQERLDTSRTATFRQVDPQTIELTDQTLFEDSAGGKSFTSTCTGTVTR